MTMLLGKIAHEYPCFDCELYPEPMDIRPALWFSEQTGGSIELKPRYTAMLNIAANRSIDELVGGFARNRRRDVKNLSGPGKPVQARMDLAHAYQLYVRQLATKDAKQQALSREREFLSILSAAENGRGFILKYRVGAESLSGFICCLKGTRTAAAVVMASTETAKRQGLPAWMILEAIKTARNLGLSRFDFTGANSPIGAAEKHGYGALARLYFAMRFQHSTKINNAPRSEACQ
jgi:GNAT superfamily N-acetyltransferase